MHTLDELVLVCGELLLDWSLCPDCNSGFRTWWTSTGKGEAFNEVQFLIQKNISPKEVAILIYKKHSN